jgi:uncharacterized protein (UPF0335 family)
LFVNVHQVSPSEQEFPPLHGDTANSLSAKLRSFVERIEHIVDEQRALSKDISAIKAQAKVAGFNPTVISLLITERRKDRDVLEQLDEYRRVLEDGELC